MLKLLGIAVLITFPVVTVGVGPNQQSRQIVSAVKEPGIYTLEQLYKTADIVALVRIVSGDTEHYDVAVYRGKVLEGFKGTKAKQALYFGPFLGQRLGWDYIVFLRNSHTQVVPKDEPAASYGTVPYSAIFNEGYTSMETSYQCVFHDGNNTHACDYAVRVCTDYIKLPKSVPVFPPMSEETDFGCRWVRKSKFTALLRVIGEPASK